MRKYLYLSFILVGLAAPVFVVSPKPAIALPIILFIIVVEYRCFRHFYLLFFCTAYAIGDYRVNTVVESQLQEHLESELITVSGVVDSLVDTEEARARFIFRVDSAEHTAGRKIADLSGARISLSWQTENTIKANERWRLPVRLKQPRGLVNPHGFDYQAWMLAKAIIARGYVVDSVDAVFIGTRSSAFDFLSIRANLAERLDKRAGQLKHAEIIKALMIGDKSDISQHHWDVFQHTGTVHLMAISGLHIGMVAYACGLLTGLLLRPLSFLDYPFFLRALSLFICVGSAVFYALLAGFSVPTQRATFMIFAVSVAIILGRKLSPLYLLLMVASIVIFMNPMQLTQPGFALSFSAVLVLLFSFTGRKTAKSKFVAFIQAQVVVLLGLFGVMSLFGLPSSFVSPLSNTVAVPLVSFVILPAVLLAGAAMLTQIPGADLVLSLADVSLDVLLSVLEYLAQFTYLHQFTLGQFTTAFILLLTTLLFLLPRFFGFLPLALFLGGLSYFANQKNSDDFLLTVLDVGQGLSTVVSFNSRLMVYDIGAKHSEKFDIASRVLLPYLHATGRRDIDLLVLSHADNDHAGAYNSFRERVRIGRTLTGEPERLQLGSEYQCSSILPHDFGDVVSEDLTLEVLWPDADLAAHESANNRSCVMLLRYLDKTFLFTGDIEKSVEHHLIAHKRLPKDVDVLVAPHHGSATSSSVLFVEHTRPRHVIFSAGYRNRYRHPAAKVERRYRELGSQVWNTAHHGALTIRLIDGELNVRAQRCFGARRWHRDEGFCSAL